MGNRSTAAAARQPGARTEDAPHNDDAAPAVLAPKVSSYELLSAKAEVKSMVRRDKFIETVRLDPEQRRLPQQSPPLFLDVGRVIRELVHGKGLATSAERSTSFANATSFFFNSTFVIAITVGTLLTISTTMIDSGIRTQYMEKCTALHTARVAEMDVASTLTMSLTCTSNECHGLNGLCNENRLGVLPLCPPFSDCGDCGGDTRLLYVSMPCGVLQTPQVPFLHAWLNATNSSLAEKQQLVRDRMQFTLLANLDSVNANLISFGMIYFLTVFGVSSGMLSADYAMNTRFFSIMNALHVLAPVDRYEEAFVRAKTHVLQLMVGVLLVITTFYGVPSVNYSFQMISFVSGTPTPQEMNELATLLPPLLFFVLPTSCVVTLMKFQTRGLNLNRAPTAWWVVCRVSLYDDGVLAPQWHPFIRGVCETFGTRFGYHIRLCQADVSKLCLDLFGSPPISDELWVMMLGLLDHTWYDDPEKTEAATAQLGLTEYGVAQLMQLLHMRERNTFTVMHARLLKSTKHAELLKTLNSSNVIVAPFTVAKKGERVRE